MVRVVDGTARSHAAGRFKSTAPQVPAACQVPKNATISLRIASFSEWAWLATATFDQTTNAPCASTISTKRTGASREAAAQPAPDSGLASDFVTGTNAAVRDITPTSEMTPNGV
jgi:hypothetical protein